MNHNQIDSFLELLSHDQLIRLDAALRFFFNEDTSQRDAYSESLMSFDINSNQGIKVRLNRLFNLSGHDFFNSITDFDRIRR